MSKRRGWGSRCREQICLSLILGGAEGRIGNVFAKVEFKCLLGAVIGRFEFEQDGKREAVVKGGQSETLGRYTGFG